MKFFLNIIFCFSYLIIKSQSLNDVSTIEIRYNFTYLIDTLNNENSISEPMILLTNGKKSVYYSENDKKFMDGFKKQIKNAIQTGSIIDPGILPKARVRHSVYKDEKEILITNVLGGNKYTFESLDKFDWQIDNKASSTIGGYKCNKATAKINGRSIIAWFTYDIPINDGPYKFRGLPGLILKLNEIHDYFSFDLISLKKNQLPIEFEKGIAVTTKNYIEKRREYINDPSRGKSNSPEYRKQIEENKRKFNNFLE